VAYDDDMDRVNHLLADPLMLRFGLANDNNVDSGKWVASATDVYQDEVRAAMAGITKKWGDNSDPPTTQELQRINAIKPNGEFMYRLGKLMTEKTLPKAKAGTVKLRCVDFVAYMAYTLFERGYTGTMHIGLVGAAVSNGHVFLVLYANDHPHETWVDQWAALHHKPVANAVFTGQDRPAIQQAYSALLPTKVRTALTKSPATMALQIVKLH
jgi:hypothetical protein